MKQNKLTALYVSFAQLCTEDGATLWHANQADNIDDGQLRELAWIFVMVDMVHHSITAFDSLLKDASRVGTPARNAATPLAVRFAQG